VVRWLAWRPFPLGTDLYNLLYMGPDPGVFARSIATQMSGRNNGPLICYF